MRAVSYVRFVSGYSFEVQQRAFLDYCAASGLEVGPTFTETVALPDAPEFRRMVRVLLTERRGFLVVVLASLTVLGASVREQARRYLQLEALGLPLRLADGTTPDEALLAAWDERSVAQRRREQVRAGMRERALHGEVLGRAPYGYRVADRHLRIHDDEAVVVREIFRRCVEADEGVRVIAGALNAAGSRTRRGGLWSMVSVRAVLRNPVYTGTYRRLGIVVPSEHAALISAERFHAAQARLTSRRTSFTRQERSQYLLAGLATCGYCGSHLIGARRTRQSRTPGAPPKDHRYYQCETRANQGGCEYPTRHADALEAAVRERLVVVADGELDRLGADHRLTEHLDRIETRRDGLRRRLEALLERRASGEWSADRLRQEASQLAVEDLQAEEEADLLLRRRGDDAESERGREALARTRARLVEAWDTLAPDEARRLLRDVVAAIVVMDDAIEVQFAR